MLSAVNSLLPSVLQFNHDGNQQKPPENGHSVLSPQSFTQEPALVITSMSSKPAEPQEVVDEIGVRKKKLPHMNEVNIPPCQSRLPQFSPLLLMLRNLDLHHRSSSSS